MFGSFLNEIASKLPEINRKDKEIYLKDKIDEKVFGDILIKVGLISIEIKNSEKSEIYYKFSLYDSNPNKPGMKDFVLGSHVKLDAEKSCICIYGYQDDYDEKNIILGMKKILFKEKILDEVYDKSEEYKNNPEKYEANTDDIIERIEKRREVRPYNLFIIKHFIKYVIDKYKEENISSEDNSANENNEDNKNITSNPFITNGE
ncbi:hypothetical protein [uncultured Brachyspira sp.]|uniref:hypothetical protein n=1 Tax=uncultured Brachyspira sp. TaxID=221953 RepID=UPI00258E8729|nr:hypothetical protein [uncultured Brachyspira sp.]